MNDTHGAGARAGTGSTNKEAQWKTRECQTPRSERSQKESLKKNVNHPSRYTRGKIECIDALESAVVGKSPDEAIYVANIIKYLWRYEEKEPLRSLMSAEWYLKRLIEKAKTKYRE